MKKSFKLFFLFLHLNLYFIAANSYAASDTVKTQSTVTEIVVQLTRSNENFGHKRSFFQIDKVLSEIGEDKLKIVVVAYEDGIHALSQNSSSAQMLTKLSNRGVTFKACRISMKAWGLTEEDFPLEVEFVAAGAPEMIRRQLAGYKYWKP